MYYLEDEELVETLENFYKTEKVYAYKGREILEKLLEEANKWNLNSKELVEQNTIVQSAMNFKVE